MITGVHTLVYTRAVDEVRAFFRDVLQWPSVDAGRGWLIFAMPPGEIAVHPSDEDLRCELYLMCDDVRATIAELKGKGVEFVGPVTEEPWGSLTALKLPGGGTLGLYQPKHPVAAGMRG